VHRHRWSQHRNPRAKEIIQSDQPLRRSPRGRARQKRVAGGNFCRGAAGYLVIVKMV
jgi:hypothetical protein